MRQLNWLSRTALTVVCLLGAPAVAGSDEPATASAAPAEKEDAATKFLRIRRDDQQQPVALETAVTRYVPKPSTESGKAAPAKVAVDLIGAVHVGEPQYYDQLNELFQKYDVVLYELVAPEGTRVISGQPRDKTNPVSLLQNVMKNVLKLEFQLDGIDYSRSNLVHADMSPQEFSQSMKERGESFLSLFFRVLADSMAMQAKRGSGSNSSEVEMLVALVAKDRSYRLKRIMAEQFETMEDQMSSLSGPKGSTLITERNKRALEVLREQIQHGKQRIAIFYGAGHLSDMERRLDTDFGLQKENQRWLVAWSIVREPKQTPAPVESETPAEAVSGAK